MLDQGLAVLSFAVLVGVTNRPHIVRDERRDAVQSVELAGGGEGAGNDAPTLSVIVFDQRNVSGRRSSLGISYRPHIRGRDHRDCIEKVLVGSGYVRTADDAPLHSIPMLDQRIPLIHRLHLIVTHSPYVS